MPQNITLDGKQYVIVPRDEFERLSRAARLPPLPEPDAEGNYPAIEYARASLARKIILRRESLGWTQAELARQAGIRVETLCRIETGKVTPTVGSIDKLDHALRTAEETHRKRRPKS